MGDNATLAKARRELEELYLGVPDESVNLTFQDLAEVKQSVIVASSEKKNPTVLEPINEAKTTKVHGSPLNKLPSLDFNKGLQKSRNHHQNHHASPMNHYHYGEINCRQTISPERRAEFRHAVESSTAFDSVSVISMASMYQEKAQRRRPGIPHSNICTVCGRVYCRDCVSVGMGEMTEGRKCIQCLGRRFSQRYIKRAGKLGCFSRYPSSVKQAELKWAEKGPRRSGERAYGQSNMMSGSRSPVTPTSRAHASSSGNVTPSFVAASSTYSSYAPNHHHLPL